jgi:hypothetical protein
MPRKQRFKPSRKPKPNPPNEDAMIGHQANGASAHNDNIDMREMPQVRDEDLAIDAESEQRSR